MVRLCESTLIPALLLVLSLFAPPARTAAVPSAARRDTDETALLREKLHKLHALLSDLYADDTDENEETKSDIEGPPPPGVKVTSDDESDDSQELGALNSKTPGDATKPEVPSKDDDSVQILARALSKLRKPEYDMEDSDGEYLGTSYNEEPHHVRDMQDVVEKALLRLKQERNRQDGEQDNLETDRFDEGQFGEFVDPEELKEERLPPLPPSGHSGNYHNDALKAVELRLMRDLDLASRLGVSVGEIIDDLDRKAYKEAELREVERQLSGLRRRPYN